MCSSSTFRGGNCRWRGIRTLYQRHGFTNNAVPDRWNPPRDTENPWDDKTKKISALFYGQHQGDTPLEHFINHECRYFRARTIRSSYRHDIHFNISLSRNQDFSSSDVERTITLNASKDGCFIYSSQNWEIRSRVWFVIQELQDQTPISGEIQWCVAWGESMQIPGIGVEFREVKPCQVEEMSTLCLG